MKPTQPTPSVRVLLVEDTASDVLLVRRSLERSGSPVRLTVAATAEEALELLSHRHGDYDVVVSDHRLPGMHGLELCQEILRREYRVGTVMLTGVGSEDLAVQALKAGVDEYLIKDTRGGYLALFTTVVEEVARRHFERQVHRRAEARSHHLAAIVESSHDAIIGCDLDQHIVSWNTAAERIFGYAPPEAIGRPIAILLPEDHGDEMPRIMLRILGGEPVEHYETIRRRQNGSTVQVSLTISPIHDEAGRVVGTSAIFRDISAQRHAEAEHRRAHHELETFVYGVTHDLKAPLLSLRGMVHLVREEVEPSNEDLETYFGHMESSLDWMSQLLENLGEMSRVGRSDTTPILVPLHDLVLQIGAELTRERGAGCLRLNIVDDLPEVWCNPRRLRQVLENLIDNAIKFSSSSEPVEIEIGAHDSRRLDDRGRPFVTCYLKDDGPGIPRGEQSRIFEMFYRRHGRDVPGTGMGLALVKRIVESMGGSVWVESEVGRGATFFFTLPQSLGSAEATLALPRPVEAAAEETGDVPDPLHWAEELP